LGDDGDKKEEGLTIWLNYNGDRQGTSKYKNIRYLSKLRYQGKSGKQVRKNLMIIFPLTH
jgi:hypothetical protein